MGRFGWLVCAALLFITGFAAVAAQASDGVALIVGSNDYKYAPQLRNARSDAGRVAGVMKKLGYEVIEVYDADQEKMAEAMETFAGKVKSARIGLVYYAGYGIQYQGNVYLVPVDLNLGNERDLRKTIPADYLVGDAATASELGIVILDACRDNPFIKQIAEDLGPARSMSVGRGLTRINAAPAKSLIAYATQLGNVAVDGDGLNSPYAEALVTHLAKPNRDVRLIFGAVRDEVVRLTGGKQEPYIYGSLGGDEIFLTRSAPDTNKAANGPLTGIHTAAIGTIASLPPDYAAWTAAITQDDWAVLADFASAYSDSLFATVAHLLVPRQAAYARPSQALIEADATRLSLTALPKNSVAAIQRALRALDFTSQTDNGVASEKTKAALAAFARQEGGASALTLAALAKLAEEAATRGEASPLTGSWKGRYEYSNGDPGVDFAQDLTFSQGLVAGYVSEPNTFGDQTSKNLYATLNGFVSADEISWLKTYDGTGGVSHSVKYQGTLDRRAGKIVGKWRVRSDWSGTFELVRQ